MGNPPKPKGDVTKYWEKNIRFLVTAGVWILLAVGVILIFVAQHILKGSSPAEMGEAIGGFAAPIMGLIAIWVTFMAFYVQYLANQRLEKRTQEMDVLTKINELRSLLFTYLDFNRKAHDRFAIGNNTLPGSDSINTYAGRFRGFFETEIIGRIALGNSLTEFADMLKKELGSLGLTPEEAEQKMRELRNFGNFHKAIQVVFIRCAFSFDSLRQTSTMRDYLKTISVVFRFLYDDVKQEYENTQSNGFENIERIVFSQITSLELQLYALQASNSTKGRDFITNIRLWDHMELDSIRPVKADVTIEELCREWPLLKKSS